MQRPEMLLSRLLVVLRISGIILLSFIFIAPLNPAAVSSLINRNDALFSTASSYSGLLDTFNRPLARDWLSLTDLNLLYAASLALLLSLLLLAAGIILTLGEARMRRSGIRLTVIAALAGLLSLLLYLPAYQGFRNSSKPDKINYAFPPGFIIFASGLFLVLLLAVFTRLKLPRASAADQFTMPAKYQLFLFMLPFLILCFLFSYLPLWGWRYAFFDYKPGHALTIDNFVGLKWFTFLLRNQASRNDIIRVMRNTLVMSGLGLLTSWMPMFFAIFLAEARNRPFSRMVQTVTTVPNFISWVLVYSFAFALFSTEGFVNMVLIKAGVISQGNNFLMSGRYIWLKMWLWGTWKGLGWSAIIYIAAISGIDQQLYEAASIDGAGRFQKMRHITLPGLLPTFSVLFLLSVAGILSNGMDQYLVFSNPNNKDTIEVLDLYVYLLGLGSGSGNIPLATVVGMLKSIISIVLLFAANHISKALRGETII